MKQENNFLPSYFKQHELQVAAILLDLPLLIEQESFPLSWSAKRKRSSFSRRPIDSLPLPLPALSPHHTPSAYTSLEDEEEEEEEKGHKELAVSPTTPLSLSLSLSAEESGSNPPPRSKRRSSPQTSEEHGRILRKEIENVRRHYKILQAENSRLKALQLQLSFQKEQERLRLAETQLAKSTTDSVAMFLNGVGYDPALSSSGCTSSGMSHNNGGAIDLNSDSGSVHVCFSTRDTRRWDESIFVDFLRPPNGWGVRAAMAAQARKRRCSLMKQKGIGVSWKRKKLN